MGGAAGPVPPPPAGEQLTLSMTKVAGTTKVYAYPGQEAKLQHMLGSMPGAPPDHHFGVGFRV